MIGYHRPKQLHVSTVSDGVEISKAGEINHRVQQVGDQDTSGHDAPDHPDDTAVNILENDDPLKQRIHRMGRTSPLRALIKKLLRRFVERRLTPEEQALLEEKVRRKKLHKVLREEARLAEKRIQNRLAGLGICYVYRRGDGENKRKIKPVVFDKVLLEPNAIWMRVNMHKLPWGVSVSQLVDKDTITNLSIAVGRKISARWHEESGVWYIIERAAGFMGIPAHVNLTDMWTKIPASKDRLTIPIGMSQNSRGIYLSLDDMVHMLIAGTTGGGKSNFLNMVLCTLIRRNPPEYLRMLLVDLKGGLEFNYYGGIPHLLSVKKIAEDGIVYEREGVEPLLDWVISEGERRMAILLDSHAKDIGEYNAHRLVKNIMPHLVVVVDEWADVKLNKRGKETEMKLANAVQRMRAVGIHMIVCTQVPQKEVLGTLIKANMPAKVAFSCADIQGSISILGNTEAFNLQPRGRCIMRFQISQQIQTPFIPKTLILDTVAGAIAGKFETVQHKHDVTEIEIMEWAIRDNDGWLGKEQVYATFRNRGISAAEVNAWLKKWEGEDFLIRSSMYHVNGYDTARKKPRRIVIKEDENPTPEPEVQQP